MSFPIRPTRDAFGPKPQNRFPVRNPQFELDGPTVGDLIMWQLAGCGVVTPLTWALGTIAAGPVVSLTASAEAFDPNAAILPAFTRTSAGVYVVQYAAGYVDKDGITQTTNLVAAAIMLQTLADHRAVAKVAADKRTIDVRVRDAAGALADPATGDGLLVLAW